MWLLRNDSGYNYLVLLIRVFNWRKYKQLPEKDQENTALIQAMRHLDKTINITWVMGHFNAAKKYIESVPGNHEARGGSDWKKYMLPKYQKRICPRSSHLFSR